VKLAEPPVSMQRLLLVFWTVTVPEGGGGDNITSAWPRVVAAGRVRKHPRGTSLCFATKLS